LLYIYRIFARIGGCKAAEAVVE
jgi:hypothetical protein